MDYTSGTDLVKHQWDAMHNEGNTQFDGDIEITQNTNENDLIKEIVFIYDDKEYKKLPDSNYPDIFINEGEHIFLFWEPFVFHYR